jgi:hypothetical protein
LVEPLGLSTGGGHQRLGEHNAADDLLSYRGDGMLLGFGIWKGKDAQIDRFANRSAHLNRVHNKWNWKIDERGEHGVTPFYTRGAPRPLMSALKRRLIDELSLDGGIAKDDSWRPAGVNGNLSFRYRAPSEDEV